MGYAYLRSVPGILKIIEEVFNLIAFCCVGSALTSPRGDAFLAASVGGFILTLMLLIIRVFDIDNKIVAPWGKIELGYCIIWSIFYLITSGLVVAIRYNPYIAGGSFGLFATAVYLVDAYDKWKYRA